MNKLKKAADRMKKVCDRRAVERRLSDVRRRILEETKGSVACDVATLGCLAHAIEARDPYTRGHSERVGIYSTWLARQTHMPQSRIELLRYAARLHDIGKVSLPDHILLKPGKLTIEERKQIELHPLNSVEILGHLRFIKKGLPGILHHHERYDGKGYPYGLKKDKIPLEARIMAIADSFDAMSSDRPYRRRLPIAEIIEQIRLNVGRQFDPRLAKIFLSMISHFDNPVSTSAIELKRKAA